MDPSPSHVARTVRAVVDRLTLDPTPRGGGRTTGNWRVLADAGRRDLVAARLAEAHLDAATIAAELGSRAPGPAELWGVWAAEAPDAGVRAERGPDGWTLQGTKPWCSGVGLCTHALVTARDGDDGRLFAVALDDPGVRARASTWATPAMADAATGTVDLDAIPADPVGGPGAYLDRPGFWHGASGVAAAWFGGALGALAPLEARAAAGRLDAHAAAHLGAADAALAAARAVLAEAAAHVDAATDGDTADDEAGAVDGARRDALRVRAVVEHAVETVLRGVARATGPGPLVHDAEHARHVADLAVYVRQSHAERDLAALGALAATAPVRW